MFLDLRSFDCRIAFACGQILTLGWLVHANDKVPFSSVLTTNSVQWWIQELARGRGNTLSSKVLCLALFVLLFLSLIYLAELIYLD